MQKIYVNTTTREFYDADGSAYGNGFPKFSYKRNERVYVQLCTETPNAGTPGVNPETDWTKNAQYGVSGISALLSVDNDFIRRRKGSLNVQVGTGSVSQIVIKFSSISYYNIPATGVVRLCDSIGNLEGFSYTSFTVSNNIVTFTLASGSSSSKAYPVDSIADCPDTLYFQAVMNPTFSVPQTGLFAFDVVVYSQKLANELEYSNTSKLDSLAGMEILLFQVENTTTTVLESFLCQTASITATMADANPNAQLPNVVNDQMVAMIIATLGDTQAQYSVDGSTWHNGQQSADNIIRFKLTGSGQGGDWFYWKFKRCYTYFGYATDSSGANFTTIPQDTHYYIANIQAYDDLKNTDAITSSNNRTLNRDAYYDVGSARAWNYNGTIYYTASQTPSVGQQIYADSAMQVLVATVSAFRSKASRPDATDFADAVWVRYIGGTTKTSVDTVIGVDFSSGDESKAYNQKGQFVSFSYSTHTHPSYEERLTTLESTDTLLTTLLS